MILSSGYPHTTTVFPIDEVTVPEFDFTETLVYYMLPSFVIFVMVAFIFYFFHPFTTDDKCFEFKRRVVSLFFLFILELSLASSYEPQLSVTVGSKARIQYWVE